MCGVQDILYSSWFMGMMSTLDAYENWRIWTRGETGSTMNPGPLIDYKALRKADPAAARLAVLQYLKSNGGNISHAARVFGINRPVVYNILSSVDVVEKTNC